MSEPHRTAVQQVEIDEPRQRTEQMLYERLMEALRGHLLAAELDAHMKTGSTMTEDLAIAEALAV